jgi:TM2 domain-containing membrane protein YozV
LLAGKKARKLRLESIDATPAGCEIPRMAEGQGSAGNVIAALASVFIPGLGQLIQGRVLPAVLMFVVCAVGYSLWWLLFIPLVIAALVHLWSIIDAALWQPGR